MEQMWNPDFLTRLTLVVGMGLLVLGVLLFAELGWKKLGLTLLVLGGVSVARAFCVLSGNWLDTALLEVMFYLAVGYAWLLVDLVTKAIEEPL
jgi:hypothetical protein